MGMSDINNKEDIRKFVDLFYQKVQHDTLIGPVFHARIPNDKWPIHLERMYGFWNTVLFAQMEYRGNPFSKHVGLPIEKVHFDRWIALFEETVIMNFEGPNAQEVITRAHKMGALFSSKLEHLRSQPNYINIV